jgi:hypothetical protein
VRRRGVILLFVLGLVLTLAGAIPLLRALPLLLNSQRALATIVAVDQLTQPKDYRIWVEYATVTGQKARSSYELTERRRVRRLVPGEQVEVFYAADNPAQIELNAPQAFWFLGWLWMVPGLFMIWLSWQGLQSRRVPPAVRVSGKPARRRARKPTSR